MINFTDTFFRNLPHFQGQCDAAKQLGDLARLSVADALAVVSTEGLLPRVVRVL